MKASWSMHGRICRLRVGELLAHCNPNVPALHPSVHRHLMSDCHINVCYLEEQNRAPFLAPRPRFQVHRRREAVRGGKLLRPSLARSISDRSTKTWPGARPKCVCPWDIHKELEDLVAASTTEDSDEEEHGEVDGDAPKRPSLGRRIFQSHDSWKRKGPREMGRERRTRSDGAARAESV
jgi:hypothetical protein